MSIVTDRLDTVARAVLARPLLVRSLQTTTIVGLGAISGAAAGLHIWVIPIIKSARSSRTKCAQFRLAIDMGFRYMQTSFTGLSLGIASLAYILPRSSSSVLALRGTSYQLALGMLLPVAVWERVMIFPTNDRLYEIGDELEKSGKDDLGDARDDEIDVLLSTWRKWHTVRVVVPLIATSMLAWSSVGFLPF